MSRNPASSSPCQLEPHTTTTPCPATHALTSLLPRCTLSPRLKPGPELGSGDTEMVRATWRQ